MKEREERRGGGGGGGGHYCFSIGGGLMWIGIASFWKEGRTQALRNSDRK